MPDPTFGLVGGGIASGIGALFGASAEQAAAAEQARLTQQALDLQRQIYEEQTALLDPFVTAGTDVGLAGLVDLITPAGQEQFLSQYYGSQQYQTLQQQSQQELLAAAAATGQLGGSTAANQLQRIAPTLGLQALEQQTAAYQQLAGTGLTAATGTAQFAGQYGQTSAGLLQDLGAYQAQQAAAYPAAFGSAFGTVGGYTLGQSLQGLF